MVSAAHFVNKKQACFQPSSVNILVFVFEILSKLMQNTLYLTYVCFIQKLIISIIVLVLVKRAHIHV